MHPPRRSVRARSGRSAEAPAAAADRADRDTGDRPLGRPPEVRLAAPSQAGDRAITHVFFDAEGTLWEPRPGRTIEDFWDDPSVGRAAQVFRLTPGIRSTLQALTRQGLTLVVMSKHDPDLLPRLLEDFGLAEFFDDVLVDDDKAGRVRAWLADHGVAPERAVMVGDRVEMDIRPLAEAGVLGVLVDRDYNRGPGHLRLRRVEDLVPTVAFLNGLRSDSQRTLDAFVDGGT